MSLATEYHSASGTAGTDFAWLGTRFDEDVGFTPDDGESWVCCRWNDEAAGLRFGLRWGGPAWLTGLWYSESRTAYVTQSRGKMSILPELPTLDSSRVITTDLPAALMGVWGLSDEYVIAWGDRAQGEGMMFLWDGKAWNEIPAPGPRVIDVHGPARDLVYAVGEKGLISRWDGHAWNRVTSPTDSVLSSVHVVSENEMYACGPGQRLLDGSIHGWSVAIEADHSLFSVAKFGDDLWVGAGELGLMRRVGAGLEVVKEKIKTRKIEVRSEMIMSAPDKVAFSPDGKSFKSTAKGFLLDALADDRPAWLR